jgi:uncharacterized UBP type Zn finger protein
MKYGDSIGFHAISQERVRLKQVLMKHHPLKNYIESLNRPSLLQLHNGKGDMTKRSQQKVKQLLLGNYFKKYPHQPLTMLMRDLGKETFVSKKYNDGICFENPKGTNLCYVNSCLNALMTSETVLNQLKNGSNSLIARSLIRLAEGNGTQNAGCFRKSVAEFFPDFNNNNQQDPMEFMYCLINILDCLKNLTRLKMQDTFQCDKCKVITIGQTDETFILSEFISGNSTTEIFMKNRTEQGFEKECIKCNLKLACHTKTETMIQTPKVLLLSLKRFNFDGFQGNKVFTNVVPDKILKLSDDAEYRLKSVIEHTGKTINSGHYTATLSVDNDWVICNDSVIKATKMPTQGCCRLSGTT